MTNVCIGGEKLTPIGQLNGTLGSGMISDLINDIDPSVFDEIIIGHMLNGSAGQIQHAKRY
ncbi:hypothetical protein N8500_01620 [Candidatus Puniceispirillum sp.]|nr:hypothetical protein [Candidatus Puniceispirillum sp.]